MNSRQTLDLLRRYESRNITFVDPDGSWPIVWERAQGVHVWASDGREYLDLTAAFGVAAAGHANPQVVHAGQRQMETLLHAMGDVHPHPLKGRLARELSRMTFERWTARGPKSEVQTGKAGKSILCNSGFEAVEAALKTARLATGKPGIIAFQGAYHGLGYGALNATHRKHFRGPFQNQLRQFGHFLPFPSAADQNPHRPQALPSSGRMHGLTSAAKRLFRQHKVGAILVEPVQARGGINVPPAEFLPVLRELCDQHNALLVVDEIYTGLGRTGKWFACEHWGVVPDVICLGKALTGGFPMSACVGRADIMDAAWPESQGEAIHTSTFLGHPVGCAMALAQLQEIRRQKLVRRSAVLGALLLRELELVAAGGRGLKERARRIAQTPRRTCMSLARGMGLMVGLEVRRRDGSPATEETLQIIKCMLRRGYILLPEGEHANVITFTPPLTITEDQIRRTTAELQQALDSSTGDTQRR